MLYIHIIIRKKQTRRSSNAKFCKNKFSKAVYQYTKDNIFIKKWDSISQINRELKYSKSNICRCCNDKQQFANGYIWKYAKTIEEV